jgi:hypothetical protein
MRKIKNFINYKVIIILLLGFFIMDQIGGFLILKLFDNSKSGITLKEKVIFFETNEDVLFFGSSRAAFHYVPEIFEEKIPLSYYNAGREGTGIFFHYALLIATIERYKPKMIILDVDFRDIYDRGGDFGEDVFGQLRPYYGMVNEEFDQYITRNTYDYVFNQSNLFKFNKKFLNLITANISGNDLTKKGFKPLLGNWKGDVDSKEDIFKYSQLHVDVLELFIKKAIENKIKLVLVVSPTNKNLPSDFTQKVNKITQKYNVNFLDFNNHSEFINKEYFHDLEHLNRKGAEKFSVLLANALNEAHVY